MSQPHWEILKDLAAKENIDLEIVGFSEYTQPNPALTEGEIDLNAFQHILYLADHNNNTGDDLQPIGSTLIVPLPLYSDKHEDVSEFTKGEQVAIPNDATNQARALFVLESAGLITFTGEPKVPTPDDVDTAASTVVVRPVEASQTAGLIGDPDIAGVVVNNNFASDAGFDLDGYVYADDPSSAGAQPYINVIAARPEDVDNPVYQRIVELYHDPSVTKSVVESSGGTADDRRGLRRGEAPAGPQGHPGEPQGRRLTHPLPGRGVSPTPLPAHPREAARVPHHRVPRREQGVRRPRRGPIRAVDGVDLTIEAGEIFGVIGYSGAGKSTLVRLINGLERVDVRAAGRRRRRRRDAHRAPAASSSAATSA